MRFSMFSLEQTKADLMESMGESRKRKDEIEVNLTPLQILLLHLSRLESSWI